MISRNIIEDSQEMAGEAAVSALHVIYTAA